ncbi:MAG TPA: transglutaminaseTgpA domain-containing protein [Acidimicrobiales bacterium]|nr:transglutaminaseTgpA domain-containing protein [Acidimicrobiales bacterium]
MTPHERVPVARDTVQLLASVLGALAVARLFTDPGAPRLAGPLVGCAFIGWLVPAAAQRLRLPAAVAVVVGTLALVVAGLWWSVPGTAGLPASHHLHAASDALRSARPELQAFAVPLHAASGAIFLASLLVGFVALFQRLLLGSATTTRSASLASLAGTLVLVAWSVTARRGGGGDALLIIAFGVVVVLSVATSAETDRETPRRTRAPFALALVALVAAAVVLVLPIAPAAPALGTPAVAPTGLSLVSRLVDLEANDPDVVLFTAHAPAPTYWPVAVLSELRNGVFVPGSDVTSTVSGRSGPIGGVSVIPTASSPAFSSSVTVVHLSSRLLPVPPGILAVQADPPATITANGVVALAPTTPGTTYTALAAGPPSPAAVAADGGNDLGLLPTQQAQSLALPAEPALVDAIALQASAAGSTPLTKAESLVDYFRSGRFAYTLTPPHLPAGTNPLVAFLTQTRRGDCEQFAGAFTVLARSLGLPTRLVVGFTAGQRSRNLTIVRGRDAHAWPEVYLGLKLGWVSFEPTPGHISGELSPQGVIGQVAIAAPRSTVPSAAPTTAPATTVPATTPAAAPSTTPSTTTSSASTATSATPSASATASSGPPIVLVVVLVALGVLCGAVAVVWVRRLRRRRRPPARRITAAWRSVDVALRRAGAPRPPGRSPVRYADDLVEAARSARGALPRESSAAPDQLDAVLADVGRLARLVEHAGYAPVPTTLDEAEDAERTAVRIRRGLRGRSVSALRNHGPSVTESNRTTSVVGR